MDQKFVEAVAYLLAGGGFYGETLRQKAERINKTGGFTVEFSSGFSLVGKKWIRYEGVVLSEEHLEQAIDLAEAAVLMLR